VVERYQALSTEAIGVGNLNISHTTQGGGALVVVEDADADV
jgi:hypothetical protein